MAGLAPARLVPCSAHKKKQVMYAYDTSPVPCVDKVSIHINDLLWNNVTKKENTFEKCDMKDDSVILFLSLFFLLKMCN